MATEAELMRAVLADPDGNQPRQAYMEWAAERGDPRADFIRVQLALAEAHRRGASVEEWSPLYNASRAYIDKGGALWRLPLEPLVIENLIDKPGFRRGFVEDVTMDATDFARNAPRVYAVAPIRYVSLRNIMDAPQALASPHLDRIRSLDLSARGVDDATITVLAGSPHARGLRWLDVSKNQIGRAGLEAIAGSPHLKGLRYVNFVGNREKDPVEEYSTEGFSVLYSHESALGRELEARYGRLEWLHGPSIFPDAFPPDPDAFV
jgi:uncharacterized protein (TIGR02996 family)